MTGTKIKIELDAVQATRLLREVETGARNALPLFTEIGSAVEASTRRRFDTAMSPEGQPWADLRPSTLRRKKTGRKLIERGDLLNSITFEAGGSFVDIFAGPTEYAAIHQFGGMPGMAPGPAAIPARPYLGISAEDEAEIQEAAEDWLARLVRP